MTEVKNHKAIITVNSEDVPKNHKVLIYISKEFEVPLDSPEMKIINERQSRAISVPFEKGYDSAVRLNGENRHFIVEVLVSDTDESYFETAPAFASLNQGMKF